MPENTKNFQFVEDFVKVNGEKNHRRVRAACLPDPFDTPHWCLMESYNEASYAAPRPYSLFEGRNN